MTSNIRIADARADRLRKDIHMFKDKPVVIMPVKHLWEYLQCMERLRFLERMLQNLDSEYYKMNQSQDDLENPLP